MFSSLYYVAILLISNVIVAEDRNTFINERTNVLEKENLMQMGGKLDLNLAEQKVNKSLMTTKQKEISAARLKNDSIPPAQHFFKAKSAIDESQVFHFIRHMPKGGVLHVHDFSMASIQWVVKNITYMSDCYMCIDSNDILQMRFFARPPKEKGCLWKLISEARNLSGDPHKFDQMLHANLTLTVPNPDEVYSSQNAIWKKFGAIFTALEGLLTYVKAFQAYYMEALQEFYLDNVQYLEIRGLLPQLYELDGRVYDSFWTLSQYEKLTEEFKKQHNDFIGAKFIFTSSRNEQNKTIIANDIQKAITMRKKFPNFFAGYDLVGQEDPGYPLIYFLDELLYPSQQRPPVDLPYFFHAGETDWQGQDVDENIIDALLLNTTRIGHGYAMSKHPIAQAMAREKAVAIEVNPISNQVLGLVADLRNHMAGPLMAQDFPLVISCDDPALWDAEALSYDFYEAFMGLGGTRSDLATLKKLAVNSINYSAMNTTEKMFAMKIWQQKWDKFIRETITYFEL